jgi:hypothetical protein
MPQEGARATYTGCLIAIVTCALLCARSAPARAGLCGDDVAGRDVPCACGDVVVSSVVLGDDPVARSVCPDEGLIVRVAGMSTAVTIDLAGATLRGSGRGTGIWVIAGGDGGARVVSSAGRATIEGFRDGILAHGTAALGLLDGVVVTRSVRDGVRIDGRGYEVRATEAHNAGRDGFSLTGQGFLISNTYAVASGRHGYLVAARNATIGSPAGGNEGRGNGDSGFRVSGAGNLISRCVAERNAGDGVRLHGDGHEINGCIARGNRATGIRGQGAAVRARGNQAAGNGAHGLALRGPRLVDAGGNGGAGNGDALEGAAAIECSIAGVACR